MLLTQNSSELKRDYIHAKTIFQVLLKGSILCFQYSLQANLELYNDYNTMTEAVH